MLINLNKALEGKFEFTLKITDLGGGSYIIPQDKSKYNFEKIDRVESE
jgi:C4-type Zn-finger protein